MHAQVDQFWLEYRPTYKLEHDFRLAMRVSYRTNFDDPRWNAAEFRMMPEKTLNDFVDVFAGVQFIETVQSTFIKTLETRSIVGMRWLFTPQSRIEFGIKPRLEYRYIYNQSTHTGIGTPRFRFRVYANLPLNQKTMSADRVCYVISNVEIFLLQEDKLMELFSNRIWLWLGTGYKVNNSLKMELVYNFQESKNTLESNKISKYHIVRILFRHTLNSK
jgi:hypothetical protein